MNVGKFFDNLLVTVRKLKEKSEAHEAAIEYLEDELPSISTRELEITGVSSGTLTEEELDFLEENDNNYIINNDEIYRLADKKDESGYRIYTHAGLDNSNYYIKCFTITLSTKGWVITSIKVQPVQEQTAE